MIKMGSFVRFSKDKLYGQLPNENFYRKLNTLRPAGIRREYFRSDAEYEEVRNAYKAEHKIWVKQNPDHGCVGCYDGETFHTHALEVEPEQNEPLKNKLDQITGVMGGMNLLAEDQTNKLTAESRRSVIKMSTPVSGESQGSGSRTDTSANTHNSSTNKSQTLNTSGYIHSTGRPQGQYGRAASYTRNRLVIPTTAHAPNMSANQLNRQRETHVSGATAFQERGAIYHAASGGSGKRPSSSKVPPAPKPAAASSYKDQKRDPVSVTGKGSTPRPSSSTPRGSNRSSGGSKAQSSYKNDTKPSSSTARPTEVRALSGSNQVNASVRSGTSSPTTRRMTGNPAGTSSNLPSGIPARTPPELQDLGCVQAEAKKRIGGRKG